MAKIAGSAALLAQKISIMFLFARPSSPWRAAKKPQKNRSELPPADKTYTFAFSSDITTRLPWTESRPLQYSVTA